VHFDAAGGAAPAPSAPDVWEEQQRLPSQWAAPSLFNEHCGGIRSANAETQEVYFMGLIDILQVYNTNKRLENFFKGFSHDRRQLSAVDPALYAERMVQFLLKHSDYADAIAASKTSARGGHGASAAASGSRRSSEPVPVAESSPTRGGQPQRHSTGGVASAASPNKPSPAHEATGATQHTPFGGPRRQHSGQQPQPQARHAESYKLL
jgi:1-phosphatidylinositol-4-phosphate 5-kinase